MPAAYSDWTVDMVDALPDDGNRYEIIDGVLFVTPAPSEIHQLVLLPLYMRLAEYLSNSSVGRLIPSPADVRRADRTRNRVQPDVLVVRLTDGKRPAYPYDLSNLLLVVEVESPSNAAYDHQTKRELYQAAAIPEYWIVNPIARTVGRWRSGSEVAELLATRLEWWPEGMSSPLVIDLPQFFDDALR